MKTCDVIIVGGGIIGLSIAWQLARRSSLRIVVAEKGASVGEGSTGASSAVCRTRYTTDELLELARDGIAAYRDWQAFTGLTAPNAEFHNDGVLWMPGDDAGWADHEAGRLRRFGVAAEVLDSDETAARFPALSNCTLAPDLETGEDHDCNHASRNLLEVDGGYVDPVAAAQDLVAACRGRGVDVRFRTRVTGIGVAAGRVRDVSFGSGEKLQAPVVINAAGPWCNELVGLAGVQLPWKLEPTRIQIVYRDRPPELEGHIPITADFAGGIYFRTQNRGQQLVVGSVLPEDEEEGVADPDDFQVETDQDFEVVKLHVLHHRLPALPYQGKVRGYCGLYTINRQDVHPVVGPTDVEGFWLANGFSGHGFKLAPVIGGMVARQLTGEQRDFDTDIRPDLFAVDRQPIELESRSVLA